MLVRAKYDKYFSMMQKDPENVLAVMKYDLSNISEKCYLYDFKNDKMLTKIHCSEWELLKFVFDWHSFPDINTGYWILKEEYKDHKRFPYKKAKQKSKEATIEHFYNNGWRSYLNDRQCTS